MDETSKDKVADAFKQGMEAGYEASRGKALAWWTRLLWGLLAGILAAASVYLTSCMASYSQTADGAVHSMIVVLPEGAAK